MKLKELNEVSSGTVKWSDLALFDNWDAKFWMGMTKYIEQYKEMGKTAAIEYVVKRVEKIGEENYTTLKNKADKELFSVPSYDAVIKPGHLRTQVDASKIVILLDLLDHKAKIRQEFLKKQLELIQKQIAALD